MKYDNKWITWFNKNKTREIYNEVLKVIPNHKKCRCCKDSIYYYDSNFIIKKSGEILPNKKSYLTKKTLLA